MAIAMSCAIFLVSSPLGPLTRIVRSSTATVTPLGMAIGSFPIRDMCSSLPDDGDELAAGTCLTCFTVRHHPLRGAEDGQAQAIADARDLIDPDVAAQSGRRHTIQRADHRLSGTGVLESNAQQPLAVVGIDHRIILNEVVLLQDAGDLGLHSRYRNVDTTVLRRTG